MKCTIPEISWHNRDPVLSIDIQTKRENEHFYRIVSGGIDSHVLIWHANILENGTMQLDCVGDLCRHQKPVNVVRFSPSGEFIASGDDESVIIIWRRKGIQDKGQLFDDDVKENQEHWIQDKILRGHLNDIYDLSWSPDSTQLISGSVDNSAILWNVVKGKKMKILEDHKNFVQGVTWDPKNAFVATLSSDSVCRVFCCKTFKLLHRLRQARIPGTTVDVKPARLFHDDTLKTFFRRLTFSPDGNLLIVPTGILEQPNVKTSKVTWLFARKKLNMPVMYFPTHNQTTTVVKCCPVLFELRPDEKPVIKLPYRMIVAVATKAAILIYDTQHAVPIAFISNIHYTKLTDLSWSSDGRLLIASSTDGYCSLVTFAEGEIGTPYIPPQSSNESVKPATS